MILEMKVPSPGESITEVEIAEWLVQEGDYVEKDQAIAEIDSDKATLELPAEKSGKIKIIVAEGETVAVGDVVCLIDTDEIQSKKSSKENIKKESTSKDLSLNQNNQKKVKSTPLADAIIKKNNLDLKDLNGSGEDGKITKNDVLEMITEMFNEKIKVEYTNEVLEAHYNITPYTFKPKVAKKYQLNYYHDLGQGVLEPPGPAQRFLQAQYLAVSLLSAESQ